jgi:hypothetical protein
MAYVKSTAHPHDDVVDADSEGAFAERDASSKGSGKRIRSVQVSDVGSHNGARAVTDEGLRMRNYYFGPSMVTVSRVKGMVDCGYFTDGMARVPREETIPEPSANKVVVFEEFFTAGLRMPPHPVLSDILLKFQV